MAIKGVFTSDAGIVGDPKGDFASAILTEMPTGTAPLFALSSGMASSPATDTTINWFEDQHISGRTTLNGALGSTSTTTIPVADASSYTPNIIVMIESTGEYMYVTDVSANSLTVVRGFAGSTAATASDGAGVQRIGNAVEEGSDKPIAMQNLGNPLFNFCQIFRNTWNITGTAQAVQYYTGPKEAKSRREAAMYHAEDIERSLWFGRKTVGIKNGKPFRTMDGLDTMIKTNVTPAGGTTGYDDLDTFFQAIFSKNIKGKPNERIAFTGNKALGVLNRIAMYESRMTITPGQTEFGMNVNRWITPYGNVTLMTHPMFVESPLWTKDIRVLHPGAMELRWLRRTSEDDNDEDGERAGVDADYGVLTSELSMQYAVEKTGGRFTGITAPVVPT